SLLRPYRIGAPAEFRKSVHIVSALLTYGDVHPRLYASRPSRGALMRRHEGGAGPAPAGGVRSRTPRRAPGKTPPATKGWPWSGHRGTRKREKPVARWTGAYLLLASALARHTPSFGGMGKETGKPQARPNLGLMKLGSLTMEYVSEAVVAGVA